MISDVLHDALVEIEEYERDLPNVYGEPDFARRLAALKALMRELLTELDTPPGAAAPVVLNAPGGSL